MLYNLHYSLLNLLRHDESVEILRSHTRAFTTDYTNFLYHIQDFLRHRQRKAFTLTGKDYDAFASILDISDLPNNLAANEYLFDWLEGKGYILDDEVHNKKHKLLDCFKGPKLLCHMLVNCDCSLPCDWEVAFHSNHSFERFNKFYDTPLFMLDETTQLEYSAKFRHRQCEDSHISEVPAYNLPCCCVFGCNAPFDTKNGRSFPVQRSQTITHLCKTHHQRLTRKTDLWNAKEMAQDSAKKCVTYFDSVSSITRQQETLTVKVYQNDTTMTQDIQFTRFVGDVHWTKSSEKSIRIFSPIKLASSLRKV